MAVETIGEIYRCEVCGNEVEVITVGGGALVCCGQEMVKIDPLTAQVIVAEPVEYYDDVKDMPSRRKEKIKAFKQNLVPESLQESLINKEITNTAIKIINSAERDGYLTGMEVSANYVTDAAKKIAKEYDKLPEEEKLTLRNSYYRKFLKSIHKA